MTPGKVVKLIRAGGMNISTGNLAVVVQGRDQFPALHKELCEELNARGCLEHLNEFIAVEWAGTTEQRDGFYHNCRFEEVTNVTKA